MIRKKSCKSCRIVGAYGVRPGVVIALIIFITALTACTTFNATTYRSLSTAATTYEATMAAVQDLNRRNMLAEGQKAIIKDLAQTYHDAYHTAAEAFYNWSLSQNEADQASLATRMAEVVKAQGELSGYVNFVTAQ